MRRWFQFRLRTAFVALTLISFACGWIGGQFREWQADNLALTALQANSVKFESARPFVWNSVNLPIFL